MALGELLIKSMQRLQPCKAQVMALWLCIGVYLEEVSVGIDHRGQPALANINVCLDIQVLKADLHSRNINPDSVAQQADDRNIIIIIIIISC